MFWGTKAGPHFAFPLGLLCNVGVLLKNVTLPNRYNIVSCFLYMLIIAMFLNRVSTNPWGPWWYARGP